MRYIFVRFVLFIYIGISLLCLQGCTKSQWHYFKHQSELHECAERHGAMTKFNSQTGYILAKNECHEIILIEKSRKMSLKMDYGPDPAETGEIPFDYKNCWDFAKKEYFFRNKIAIGYIDDDLNVIPKNILIDIYNMMSNLESNKIENHCDNVTYQSLVTLIGIKIKRM